MGLFRRKQQPSPDASSSSSGDSSEGVAEKAFLDEMTRRLGDQYPGAVITPNGDFALDILHPDGETGLLSLHTLWAELQRSDPATREQRIHYAVMVARPPQRAATFAEARTKLQPVLRSLTYLGASQNNLVSLPHSPFVVELIAIDEEFGMSFVTHDDLETWNVDEQTVREAMAENFVTMQFGMETEVTGPSRQLFGPDGFSSSVLLATSVCAQVEQDLGPCVFVAPSREVAYAVQLSDPEAAAVALTDVFEGYQSMPRQLSPLPYQLVNGELMVWDPPLGHPCRTAVDNAHRILALVEYAAQTDALTHQFSEADEDVFVAQSTMVEVGGIFRSYAVWPQGVNNGLLPRVDRIAFQDGPEDALFVDFALAQEYVADLLIEEPMYAPTRFRITTFPAPEVIDRLRPLAADGP
jgi:hypothetical protein